MRMKKSTPRIVTFLSGTGLILTSGALALGTEPGWLLMVIFILCTPVCVLSLFLSWSAATKEGDYPFMGY